METKKNSRKKEMKTLIESSLNEINEQGFYERYFCANDDSNANFVFQGLL